MKYALIALSFLLPATVFADVKLGYVDSERLLAGMPAFEAVQKQMEELKQQYDREVQEKYNELISLEQTYRRQSLLLSESRRSELEQQYQEKALQFREFSESVFGLSGKFQMKYEGLVAPIYAEISAAIEAYAKEHEYDMILDAAAARGLVVFARQELDLTDNLLARLTATN